MDYLSSRKLGSTNDAWAYGTWLKKTIGETRESPYNIFLVHANSGNKSVVVKVDEKIIYSGVVNFKTRKDGYSVGTIPNIKINSSNFLRIEITNDNKVVSSYQLEQSIKTNYYSLFYYYFTP